MREFEEIRESLINMTHPLKDSHGYTNSTDFAWPARVEKQSEYPSTTLGLLCVNS